MKIADNHSPAQTNLRIPDSLKQQLLAYRRRVWQIKLTEAVAIVVAGIGLAFLLVYGMDRFTDTPAILRGLLWIGGLALIAIVPWAIYKWVYKHQALEPLAKLLSQKMPSIGDRLLGVIELTHNASEQARSPELCQAAMTQVADDAAGKDFRGAAPNSWYKAWTGLAAATVLAIGALAVTYPAATGNAMTRLLAPWGSTPRYTFTRIDALANDVYIPHGEPVVLPVALSEDSRWQPESAELHIGQQKPIQATLRDGQYAFAVPPQLSEHPMSLTVGDVKQSVKLKPTLRPELSKIVADVNLPEYLGQPEPKQIDTRGGSLTVVRGSRAVVTAIANRELADGKVNEQSRPVDGPQLASDSVQATETETLQFQWRDQMGLTGREPFTLSIEAIDDEAPTLICDGLERQAVVLDSETLTFQVRANDDFGIRRVGIQWKGMDVGAVEEPAEGERALAAGDPAASSLEAMGTFSAKSLGIPAQPIELQVWAEDYLPERARVLSPPFLLYVLTPDQHAIWMTEQLSKWHRQALDVRDRERQLHEKNKQLRALSADEVEMDQHQRDIERQAAAERSNGRRLERLGQMGDQLVLAASKNPEIGVGHLERWAEMLQVLQDLSDNRMPSVANLLDDAAQEAPKIASKPGPKSPGGPKAGQSRAGGPGPGSEMSKHPGPKPRAAPQLADMESSANSPDEGKGSPGGPKKPSNPALRLPTTTVMGKSQPSDDKPKKDEPLKMAQAITEQKELLDEFDKIADELNLILANLEGSTLVKRLKAASRKQNLVAKQLTNHLEPAFGQSAPRIDDEVKEVFTELQTAEDESTEQISYIMDDMEAYFERRRFAQFKVTLDEMKSSDVIGGLRQLSAAIKEQQGMSVAQCEFWSDSLDRWAENLVDPACNGSCPGGKSPESLPPSIVRDVMQILESEVNLRDETRVAEQAKAAVESKVHKATAETLAKTQTEINERVVDVIERIRELPDATKHFGKELKMLTQVDAVMTDATSILKQPNTGSQAIAAETEAIELILRSKRINPKGGGGGGSSPGGGSGGGNSADSALALLGKSKNEKEVRENKNVTQSTGETGAELPEEFRRGLDQYFSRLGGT
ncbi:hypothetical protein [Rhodopirellula europaea]|uniref:Putative membrane protein n=1 Tax=Rhodopirellula europaea SH398 TaxID=1263868 RepID=M5SP92_9BACT|nr:hypothetical protein [Rhodopirellula europaea]EMI28079.1 putative membrane protein [Rhodopirellula europaea SH398]